MGDKDLVHFRLLKNLKETCIWRKYTLLIKTKLGWRQKERMGFGLVQVKSVR